MYTANRRVLEQHAWKRVETCLRSEAFKSASFLYTRHPRGVSTGPPCLIAFLLVATRIPIGRQWANASARDAPRVFPESLPSAPLLGKTRVRSKFAKLCIPSLASNINFKRYTTVLSARIGHHSAPKWHTLCCLGILKKGFCGVLQQQDLSQIHPQKRILLT